VSRVLGLGRDSLAPLPPPFLRDPCSINLKQLIFVNNSSYVDTMSLRVENNAQMKYSGVMAVLFVSANVKKTFLLFHKSRTKNNFNLTMVENHPQYDLRNA